MTPDLSRFTRLSRESTRQSFTSLMGMLWRPEGLLDSFRNLASNKAPGVDGVRKANYAEGLDGSIEDLSGRLRRGSYRPQPVRRVYIPKATGGWRPLGIPAFEDRIVQDRMSKILMAIWEPEFLGCSYGFRPGRSAHEALRRIDRIVMQGRSKWVVEADIKGFFNHVDHEWLMRFLKHRIADERFVRTIHRFLKGGVMEDGVVSASEEGTPQGGLVSPVLSNIYLHYVLDLWFERRFSRSCRGRAELVRYCDDFVVLFDCEDDARKFMIELGERLAKFGLEVEPSKTRLMEFGVKHGGKRRGNEPRTFGFLGFTHYIGKSRRGHMMLLLQTSRARFGKKLRQFGTRLRRMRIEGTNAMIGYAARHVMGHMQYYGVSGNAVRLNAYVWRVRMLLFKWLNRRSQKKSTTMEKFDLRLASADFPRARIVHQLWA